MIVVASAEKLCRPTERHCSSFINLLILRTMYTLIKTLTKKLSRGSNTPEVVVFPLHLSNFEGTGHDVSLLRER